MAFSYTPTDRKVMGNQVMMIGTFTMGGDTTGYVVTSLSKLTCFSAVLTTGMVTQVRCWEHTTNGTLAIYAQGTASGLWYAIGN